MEIGIWPDYKSVDLLVPVVSYRAQGSFSVSIGLLSAPKDVFLAQLFNQIFLETYLYNRYLKYLFSSPRQAPAKIDSRMCCTRGLRSIAKCDKIYHISQFAALRQGSNDARSTLASSLSFGRPEQHDSLLRKVRECWGLQICRSDSDFERCGCLPLLIRYGRLHVGCI